MTFRSASRLLFVCLATVALLVSCQRGEKSCRYYSLVLERSDSPEEQKRAIETIRRLSTEDHLKCDDDKVYARFTAIVEKDAKFRPLLLEAQENIGRASEKLRLRAQKLLTKGLGFSDSALVSARVVKTWRLEEHERGKTWLPEEAVIDGIARALKRVTDGPSRVELLDALWLGIPDAKGRAKYEDLLIELADTDPATQSVEVNLKSMKFLTEMRSQKDGTFDAYTHGLFMKDAAGAETYGQARLGLATLPPLKVADRMLSIYQGKNVEFQKWSKGAGLYDWEWKEGPKLQQILSDLHDPRAASAIVSRAAKAIDASETGEPKIWKTLKKNFPWSAYITSRLQLTMWGLAGMGEGLKDTAEQIGELARTVGPTVEQRTMPFIALGISGASNSWEVMLKTFQLIDPMERADFITPLIYAVEPKNLEEWDKVIGGDKSEGTVRALADPSVVARLNVVRECAKQVDAAEDAEAKNIALAMCYAGYIKTGDNLAKEKAAVGLVHMAAAGQDVVVPLLAAFQKSQPIETTLRQVLFVGLKVGARPTKAHMAAIYRVQQLQVQVPNNVTWDWEFDVMLGHLLSNFEAANGAAAPAEAPAAPAGAPADAPAAPAGAPTAPGAAPG